MPSFHIGFPSPSIADLTMPENAALAHLCEEHKFDTLWHSNERFYREMFIRMTSSTLATKHIGIGGAVVEPFAVHPLLSAQSIATLQELSGGRAALALGAGGSGFQMMGVQRRKSAAALREAYTVMGQLLAGDQVTFEGEVVRAYQARLQFTPPPHIQLWIATRGDLTLETSGEYAEAIIIATYATPAGVGEALQLIEKGLERSGRHIGDLRIMSRVDTCVHQDPQLAIEGTRTMVARFLWSSYPDCNFVTRAGLEVPKDIKELIAKRDNALIPQIAARIPQEFTQTFCWAGEPAQVADRLIDIGHATGVREFGFWVLLAPGQSREQATRLIAEEIVPRVRSALAD